MTGRTGGPVLNPQLPEWMLGLPDGWVTAVPGIARTAALRILGNGVAPAQGAAALRILLDPTTGDPMDDEPVPAGQARIFTPLDPPVPRMPLPPVGKGAPPAQWSTVARGGRHRCDECVRAQMLDPAAPVARAARHKRAQGAVDMLLCDGHARPIRDRDQREAKRAAR